MATSLMPVNFSAADAHASAGLAADLAVPVPPAADQLNNWAQESYSMEVSAAASLGFPVGNFATSAQHQALLFGVSRWKDVTAGGHSYRFGVALRVIIVVNEIKVDGALTLPVVAAKVELDGARATAQMLVRGYKGTQLAANLPAWQSFGVDSYAAYMKAVSDIQAIILADNAGIDPELLATTVVAPPLPSAAAAAGTVYALHAIADGLTLARALAQLENHDRDVAATAHAVYQARLGADELAAPTPEQRTAAVEQLYGLHVGHRLPWQRD
ncbi:MAG: hypothetical protein ACTHMU_02340 [Thermomicrobiales bacterium]